MVSRWRGVPATVRRPRATPGLREWWGRLGTLGVALCCVRAQGLGTVGSSQGDPRSARDAGPPPATSAPWPLPVPWRALAGLPCVRACGARGRRSRNPRIAERGEAGAPPLLSSLLPSLPPLLFLSSSPPLSEPCRAEPGEPGREELEHQAWFPVAYVVAVCCETGAGAHVMCSCLGACWGWAFTSPLLLFHPCLPCPSFPEPRLLLCWGFSRVMTSKILRGPDGGCLRANESPLSSVFTPSVYIS